MAESTGPGTARPSASGSVDLGTQRHIHVVGIGGTGMAPIATVLVAMGHAVSGSDLHESANLARLRTLGVRISVGHDPSHLDGADVVVASSAVPAANVELVEAHRRGMTVLWRSDALAAICATRRTVAVAGTKGKTTTAAMLASILAEAGWHPSFIIGGDLHELGHGARWCPEGQWLVVEADESDGTFLHLRPEALLVTNVLPDHLDYWGGPTQLHDAFAAVVGAVPGVRVLGADDPGSASLALLGDTGPLRSTGLLGGTGMSGGTGPPGTGGSGAVATFGMAAASSVRMLAVRPGRRRIGFDVEVHGTPAGRVELGVPGAHNARNACGALAMALALGVPFDVAARALGAFREVARRFEWRGEAAGVTYIDDYAHLPSALEAVLATARDGAWSRVVAVFQPHRFSRTASLHADFADAFVDADVVVLTDVYGAGEAPRDGITGRLVVDAVTRAHPDADVRYVQERAELADELVALLRPGDLCLTLGAGDLDALPSELLARAEVTGRAPRPPSRPARRQGDQAVAAAVAVLGPLAQVGMALGALTTYRVGGPAAIGVVAGRLDDLYAVGAAASVSGLDVLVVGRGSNLLVADAGFPGIAVVLDADAFATFAVDGRTVRAGAALALPALARRSVDAGLAGLEWAVGVPGSVGGGVRMNAGGHGSEMAETLVEAEVVDMAPGSAAAPVDVGLADLGLGYRRSSLRPDQVVVSATFMLRDGDREQGRRTIREIVRWRREHQPGGQNAGSVFVNPAAPGEAVQPGGVAADGVAAGGSAAGGAASAGWLIDGAGLKGLRLGTAQVSGKHANFIQADSGGSADDVRALMVSVRDRVLDRWGVDLRTEIRLIGFSEDSPSSEGRP